MFLVRLYKTLLVLAIGALFILATHVLAQPPLSYQARVAINEMMQSDLQTQGSSVTINQSAQMSYEEPGGFDGLSTNTLYAPMAQELADSLNSGDLVVITSAGANIIQNGNSFPLNITLSAGPSMASGSANGIVRLFGTLESPNNQFDTFLPNLPGVQEDIKLYVVYGPNLQQRTDSYAFNRGSCGTSDLFDFCFDETTELIKNVYREDFFAIYQDLPRTIRDIKLIGPYTFDILSGTDDLASFEQRWYYVLYDWEYTRPDGSRSQTFSTKTACDAQASLVTTNTTCVEVIGNTMRHSHYFDEKAPCFEEVIAITGNSEAQCYSTQVRNVQITFDIPLGAVDGSFPQSPATYVGQTSALLNGTIDTKGFQAPVSVEAFGVPRYVLDANNNPVLNANGFKLESRNNSVYQQPFGSTYQRQTLSLSDDPNIHELTTQTHPQGFMTNPNDPKSFTIGFNTPSSTTNITFSESLRKDYIYYYRVHNPIHISDGQTTNIFQKKDATIDINIGMTYSQGWFTTGDLVIETGGEVLGGIILNAGGTPTVGTIEIADIDGLVACGKRDQVRYYYVIETPAVGDELGKRSWSQFYSDKAACEAVTASGGECFENTMCTYNDFIGLIDRIIGYLLLLIGPLAAIMFAYAGFLLVTSHENAEKRTQARKIFMNTAIGIVIILLAWVAVAQFLHMLGLDPDYVLLKIGS
jgi:hypothetical protein